MSITYKWSVSKVQVIPQQNGRANIINKVDWLCQGVDDQTKFSAAASGVKELQPSDSFIEFNQLTEQQVLDWCFLPEITEIKDFNGNTIQTNTTNLKNEGEQQIAGQIEQKLTQQAIEPELPWSVNAPVA
jgi:hypothetical protein